MASAHSSSARQIGDQSINVGDTERIISAVVGGCAVLFGLSKLSLSSVVALAAGGALLARGLTGHCRVYEALETSTADAGSMCCGSQKAAHRHSFGDAAVAATGELPPF
jgi:uncharacterized membrane protein